MAAQRIEAIETCVVSLPLDRPVVTPIHHITTIDCVLVTAKTDGGLSGIGYLWTFGPPRARTLEAMVRDLAQLVRGADPLATEAVWRRMWNDTNFLGHAGISMLGMSAIDTALWDIKGKALGQPLYRLLGGERRKLPVYAGGLFLSDPIDAIVAEAKDYVARGFRAMKMRTGARSEREDIARVEAVRAAIGPDVTLMVDVVQGWTVEQSIRMGRALAPYDLFWIEDPVLFDDLEGLARIAAALDTPIACGENDYSKLGFARLIGLGAADFPMPDLQRVGGVTEWMKVAAMADAARLPVVPHVFHEISVHMAAAAPNASWLEYVPWWDRLFREPVAIVDGTATPPDRPGLGLEFDWNAIDRFRQS
jgi:L-alanine-DL-glutamate epimerase-like enolase superfamily enzyme